MLWLDTKHLLFSGRCRGHAAPAKTLSDSRKIISLRPPFCENSHFCATLASIAKLGGVCTHPPGSYQVIAGAKRPRQISQLQHSRISAFTGNAWHLSLTHTTKSPSRILPTFCRNQWFTDALQCAAEQGCTAPRAVPTLGIRLTSSAHTCANAPCARIPRCISLRVNPSHPVADHHQFQLVQIGHEHLHPGCSNPQCTHVVSGQPFRLQLLYRHDGSCNERS